MTNDTEKNVEKSISSIYSQLLNKRREEKDKRNEEKRLAKEARKIEKEEENYNPLTKKEKREASISKWSDILVGLTGDDLEYSSDKKKNKKRFKKWILEDSDITISKPPKKKKRNYNKEFEPELNMLKSIVSEQNKFTMDLLKRYQLAAGPNTKDAMPLNKTLVELAGIINNSRGNSLSILREIGSIKKTIADLYMKQRKLDSEISGDNFNNTQDLGLLGSNLAASLFNNSESAISSNINSDSNMQQPIQSTNKFANIPTLDPNNWEDPSLINKQTLYETIPHKIIVEYNKDAGLARFKAIRDSDGEELLECPKPTCNIKSMDLENKIAKDSFDQIYPLEILESVA